jgi:glucose uptake protein GlcU
MLSIIAVIALIMAGLFFGSQFVPQKFCPSFETRAYNLSMMFGIAIVSGIIAVLSFFLDMPGNVSEKEFTPSNIGLCVFAGVIWSLGNLYILSAISKIGISRTFPIVNLVVVVAFFAGIIFLGELRDIHFIIILFLILGIASVLSGSYLTTKATSKEEKNVKDVKGGVIAAALSTIFFGFYNIPILMSLESDYWSVYLAVFFLSLGTIIGAIFFGFLWLRKDLFRIWRRAQRKWHYLAISGGMIWGIGQVSANMAMVDIGVSIGAPSIQGLVIVVGVVWGLAVFKELKDIPIRQRKKAKLILGFGCAFALLGSIIMGFVASLLF